jgi:adenosylcobinamide kinase/adenosylcobinamide-phosphate guanylyltransferase
LAEKLAGSLNQPVVFIATATAGDDEMRARIARHRAERPQTWHTLEEPLDLAGAIKRGSDLADVLLLDCMTLWLSNFLLRDWHEEQAIDALFAEDALQVIKTMLTLVSTLPAQKTLIVVSNEVGLGLVPEYPLGRVYRDALGAVNQLLACAADRAYLLVAGIAVDLKQIQVDPMLL